MEDTSGFYLYQDEEVYYASNRVLGPYGKFEIRRENKDEYDYPIHGWRWFETKEEAYSFYRVDLPEA